MLELIGWFALVILMFYISAAWSAVALNCLGEYNIGGVPNKIGGKILVFIGLFAIGFCWYQLALAAPFKIISA